MDKQKMQNLAKELAFFINKFLDIPFVNEEEEQFFFELILLKALQLVLGELQA